MLPRLREEHQRVQRTGLTSSVCMVDLDHFKQINDTYGHQAGDPVLEAVSAYLVDNLRRYDQVCRYGGEEFVLMLPNTAPQQAVPIVDRLRCGLAELCHPARRRRARSASPPRSASRRCSADQPIGASIEDADQAMYAAKRAGRNRVRVWRDPGNAPERADDADRDRARAPSRFGLTGARARRCGRGLRRPSAVRPEPRRRGRGGASPRCRRASRCRRAARRSTMPRIICARSLGAHLPRGGDIGARPGRLAGTRRLPGAVASAQRLGRRLHASAGSMPARRAA